MNLYRYIDSEEEKEYQKKQVYSAQGEHTLR